MSEIRLRALALFDRYLDLSEAGRSGLRTDLARRDPDLLAALTALAEAAQAPSPLDVPALDALARRRPRDWPAAAADGPAADPRIGAQLGPWRIVEVIAEGGMGTVYEARRADGHYQQRVALKCVRAKLRSPVLVEAFLAERGHLAALDHPGIAVLIDGGVEADGQPWFAMRLVEGTAIDLWCDARDIDTAGRVRLLLQACEAVAYAHARGVLHRDLKPANLLVNDDGRVHLVDFGIASAFTGERASAPQIAFSRDYAAPELLAGGGHGATGDVYAMGMLMHRLLCGALPASAARPWPGAVDAAAAARSPGDRRPGRGPLSRLALAASAQRARLHGERDPAALARRLAGDLDAIARKAVASRPECRYPSMREFADDLRRWLQLRPVHAQRSGGRFAAGLYRACTFLRRHRSAAALATPLLLALALAAGAWSWQQHRRAEEARAAEAVGQLFASTLGTATLAGLGSAPFSSERLLQHTEAQLRELRLHRHPALYARSLATLARSRAVIGDYDRAQALAEQARQALGETVDESGYVAATRLSLLNTMARYAQAAALARQSLRRPHRREDADERAALMAQLATAQWGMGEVYPALDTLGAALSQVRALGPAHDELQAQMLIQRSGLRAQLYRYPGADDDARRAIALAEGRNPILADDGRQQLLDVLLTRGGQVDVAIAKRLLAGRRRSLGERHPKTGMAWIMLGSAEYAGGRIVSAKARNATGRELILAAYGRDHPAYARALTLQSYIDSRDSRDNLAALREALAIYRRTLGPAHDSTLGAKQRLAARLSDLPHAQQRSGDFAEIVALHRDNLRLKRRANLPTPWEDLYLGRAWMRSGGRAGLARAEPLLRSSRLQAQRYFAREDRYSLLAQDTWASFLYLNGDKARAAGEFARILERQLDRRSYVSVVLVHSALLHRAAYALENCDRRQARELLERAYAYDLRRMGAANFLTQDARTYLDSLRRHGVLLNQDRSSLLHPALAATNAVARRCPRRAPAASAHRPR